MTALYLLIAALIFFVIGYMVARSKCTSQERYMATTPMDPITQDEGECEEETLESRKKEEALATEKLRLEEEEKRAAEKEALEAVKRAEEKERVAKEAEKKEEARKKEEVEKKEAAEKNVTSKTKEPEIAAPMSLLDAPRNGKKDNLTRIKGIGMKIDEALNSIGIFHFDQIAAWTEENMAWADRELAFPGRAKRDDWVGQAKLLAEGKETEFSKRVDKGEVSSSKKV